MTMSNSGLDCLVWSVFVCVCGFLVLVSAGLGMKERPRAITGACHFSIIVKRHTLHQLAGPFNTLVECTAEQLEGQMLMEWMGFWRAPLIL